ncbi:MAG: ATP-dependent helicase [Elusimicrobia bacterium]|nr:ATP-dependent helicase [Elusimicrobiota bacterium]
MISSQKIDTLLQSLNEAQRQAVTYDGRRLLVYAGPGTGKTRVIIARMAYLIGRQGIDPESMLAITFTNKAAAEMKNRLDALLAEDLGERPWIGTFHSFALWLLHRHWRDANLPKGFVIYDADDQKSLMREILSATPEATPPAKAGIYLDVIQRLKDDLMDAKSYAIHTDVSSNPHRSEIARIYLKYQEMLRSRGALDFGDLLLEANTLIREHPEIAQSYQQRFHYLLVDEYQDVNRSQYALMKALHGEQGSLTCVGDDDQVIYEWRNADPRYTLEFDKEFKGAGAVILNENYRSTPNVLEAATKVIRHNEVRKDKNLAALRPAGSDPEVIRAPDEKEEARLVSARVKALLGQGVAPSEIAIFYRINAQSRNFEMELRAQGVPYRLVGSLGFYSRREIKDLLSFARLLVNSKDEISLWRVFTNFPEFSITKDAIGRVKEQARLWDADLWNAMAGIQNGDSDAISRRAAQKIGKFLEAHRIVSLSLEKRAPLGEIFEMIAQETKYLDSLDEEDRSWNVWEFIESAKEFERQHAPADLLEFLNHTSLLAAVTADNNRDAKADAVSLMTVHLAKGLEFKAVFLTGLEEGLFPFKVSKTNPRELEEERRIFYVGMTRAKDALYLTYAQTRLVFGSENAAGPSRFLFEAGLMEGGWNSRPSVRRGARVKHPLFGEGRIVAMTGSDRNAKVTVHFSNGATRKFLVSAAPLEVF